MTFTERDKEWAKQHRMENGYDTGVADCPRCGQDHESIWFAPLDNPIGEWEFWAPCPTTHQPILGKLTEDHQEDAYC